MTANKRFEYPAIKVVQRPGAMPFYLVGSAADLLLEWADVPRKKEEYMAGYQRELDDRHKRIARFIEQDPKNIVPGSVIVAVRSEAFSVVDEAPSGVCRVAIDYTARPYEDLLKSVYDEFLSRLSESERASIALQPAETSAEELDDESEDESMPESYLARLTRELQVALSGASVPPSRLKAVEDFVRGVTKPGLIIDGQHRVFGAKDVEAFDVVNLPVVLLPGLSYSEQVFHFYVLNNKAKPLKPTELRATISTSLTRGEIESLYDRLRKSGVKAEEARWTHEMNTNPASPFRGLIDFGFADGGGIIGENAAFQVVSQFMKPDKKRRILINGVTAWADEDYKLRLFFAFWQAIAERYPKAWAEGQRQDNGKGQIFYKASMQVLQEYILESMVKAMPGRHQRNQPSPFADPADVAAEVRSLLFYLPEEFFTRPWQETGLDTPERRKYLKNMMNDAVNNLGEKIGYLSLFKKKS